MAVPTNHSLSSSRARLSLLLSHLPSNYHNFYQRLLDPLEDPLEAAVPVLERPLFEEPIAS